MRLVVIPVHNALDCLKTCLEGLDRWYPDRQLILVDDASDGPVRDFLRIYAGQGKGAFLLRREHRGWFTRAANQGLAEAYGWNGDRVVMLNSDTRIGEGCFEEMEAVWAEAGLGGRVGLVGAEGPRPSPHPRYAVKQEPGYVTGHALLLSKSVLKECDLRFPQEDGEVQGFTAQQLIHISSDKALSYQMNRKGLLTVASYWADLGHVGGQSWGYRLHEIPQDVRSLEG
jgi:glycosyltransferase involved in cell wall biosynthesis